MTALNESPTRFRLWRDLRWIAGGIVTLFVAWLAWDLFGPEPGIRVSRETTLLTAPLAVDGLPDYKVAALATYAAAPPPEENAAVLLLRARWPLGIDSTELYAVCKALGIPNEGPQEPLLDPDRDAAAGISQEMLETANRPWTEADMPALAAWMRASEPKIDLLVEATSRPRYWLPSPTLLSTDSAMLFFILLPDLQELRGVARILRYRAMWHVAENRPAEAWRDVLAIHRLARLIVPPDPGATCLITQLVVIAIDAAANEATRWLLSLPDLPADVLATIRRDVDALGPPFASANPLAFERLGAVDAFVWLAGREPRGRVGRVQRLQSVTGGSVRARGFALLTSLDWNIVLERLNTAFDELEAACGLPTHAERVAALERHERELRARAGAPFRTTWTLTGDVLMQLCNRAHRSERVGDLLLAMLTPALGSWQSAVTRSAAQFELMRAAAALAGWRVDREPDAPEYPERLDDLVPRYLAAVPVDPFSGTPFIYERRRDGYLLASVGQNGAYDGGTDLGGRIVKGEWQAIETKIDPDASDLVVRMPMPSRKSQTH